VLRKHGILLIFDEVVTAYGRVGEWFAAQHFNVQPDIIITAKGITSGYIPLGAVLTTDAVAHELEKDFGFPMGFTYNGHPTAAAVALKNLEIIEQEGLLEKAKKMGQYLHEGLRTLLDLPIVGEVRFVGMMHAVELVTDKETRTPLPMLQPMLPDVIRREEGVIVRDCGHNLVLSPPLIMTEAEADRIIEQIADWCEIPDLAERIVVRRTMGPANFVEELNAWSGTALGMAHTLQQSAFFRPKNRSKKIKNLFYAGHNTIPGIGLPMCLIGAELVYKYLVDDRSNGPIEGELSPVPADGWKGLK
jgi:hypothetical protein